MSQSIWWFNFGSHQRQLRNLKGLQATGWKQNGADCPDKETQHVCGNGLLPCRTLLRPETLPTYLFMLKALLGRRKVLLFGNQGISNLSNTQYLEKDYFPRHEFSHHGTLFLLRPQYFLGYVFMSHLPWFSSSSLIQQQILHKEATWWVLLNLFTGIFFQHSSWQEVETFTFYLFLFSFAWFSRSSLATRSLLLLNLQKPNADYIFLLNFGLRSFK